jgi:[ribosomal protein S5]-alanine N-acetyltransferase
MVTPDRTWETARILAKPANASDAPVLFEAYTTDAAVARYMIWTPHRSVDETMAFASRCEQAWADGTAFPWTLWRREDGACLGMLEIRIRAHAVDLGYVLARRWWRQGFMSEAVEAVVRWALAQPTIHRVWATCDVENVASARLLERVGMEREGILRRWIVHPNLGAIPRDCYCYSRIKSP